LKLLLSRWTVLRVTVSVTLLPMRDDLLQAAENPTAYLAERLRAAFPVTEDGVCSVDVAGPGFLNFTLAPAYLHSQLSHLLDDPKQYGVSDAGHGERWHFEFVSANPPDR